MSHGWSSLFIRAPRRESGYAVLSAGALACLAVARSMTPAGGDLLPGVWLPPCLWRSFTGVPCPFCGLTHGLAWLMDGRLDQAWLSNILSPLVGGALVLLLLYGIVMRLGAGRALRPDLVPAARRWWGTALGLAIVLSWAVNLARS